MNKNLRKVGFAEFVQAFNMGRIVHITELGFRHCCGLLHQFFVLGIVDKGHAAADPEGAELVHDLPPTKRHALREKPIVAA